MATRQASTTRPAEEQLDATQRTLAALEVLARHPEGVTPKELSRSLRLHLSTAYRLLNTLVATGYSVRDPKSGLFRLAQRVAYLHRGYVKGMQPSPAALPFVHALQLATGATALLSRLEGDNVVCAAVVPGNDPAAQFPIYVGIAGPAHPVASGKVILAWFSRDRLEAYLERCAATADSPFPLTDPAGLRAELAQIRQDGYAVDRGVGHPDVCCVAAPIGADRGEVELAVNVMVSGARLRQEEPALVAAVRAAAQAIDAMCAMPPTGGQPPALHAATAVTTPLHEIEASMATLSEIMSRVS